MAGQLAALAGLGALGHLDLQLVGVDEVVDGHAEAPGGHLLDGRAPQVAVVVAREAPRVLPALARVRAPAEAVHGDGQRLVGLGGDRAQRHRAGGEALDDLLGRLDLVQRDRLAIAAEGQQPAQRGPARGVGVDQLGVLVVLLLRRAVEAPDGVLQQRDRLGVPHVVLAVAPPGVDAADGQQALVRARPRARVAIERLAGQHAEPDAADARRGAGEVAVDERLLEAHRLEDLRAAVALDGRDPHLGDRLQQALAQRLDDPLLGLVGVLDAGDAPVAGELVDGVEHQIGVDGARAVADEHGEVVDLARLAGLEHESRAQARALAHEVVVHGADGQQRGDRRALGTGGAVGEDEDVDARRDVVGRLVAHVGQALLHPRRALVDRPRDVDRVRAEDVGGDRAQRLELGVAQDRLVHHELMGVLGTLGEQVALGAHAGPQRHDDRLAGRVDRRVGDLREELLEVAEQRRALVGEDRQRGVVAHRADGLLARARHRGVEHAQVLLRVAEGELALAQRELGRAAAPAPAGGR